LGNKTRMSSDAHCGPLPASVGSSRRLTTAHSRIARDPAVNTLSA
jgi:hypothetical protein